jgi:hypothetical protein
MAQVDMRLSVRWLSKGKKKGQGKMEFSEKLTPDELLSLYSDRIKKERQDEAVSLENTVRLESGGKLRTKIFEYGLGGNFTANVFILDETGDTLLVVSSVSHWNRLRSFVALMTMPSDEEIVAMENGMKS